MKQVRMAAIFMALVLGGLTSCTKDSSGTSSASTTSINSVNKSGPVKGEPGVITAALEQARWSMTYTGLGASGTDFTGFEFTFVDGGYVAAINGEVVYNGTWAVDEAQSNLFMDFGITPPPLSSIKGNWHVTEVSNTLIRAQRADNSAFIVLQKVGPNTPGN